MRAAKRFGLDSTQHLIFRSFPLHRLAASMKAALGESKALLQPCWPGDGALAIPVPFPRVWGTMRPRGHPHPLSTGAKWPPNPRPAAHQRKFTSPSTARLSFRRARRSGQHRACHSVANRANRANTPYFNIIVDQPIRLACESSASERLADRSGICRGRYCRQETMPTIARRRPDRSRRRQRQRAGAVGEFGSFSAMTHCRLSRRSNIGARPSTIVLIPATSVR